MPLSDLSVKCYETFPSNKEPDYLTIHQRESRVTVFANVLSHISKQLGVFLQCASFVVNLAWVGRKHWISWKWQRMPSAHASLKPIFHQNAKYLASGTFASGNAKSSTFALADARNTNMLVSFALGDANFLRWPCTFHFLCVYFTI